MGVVYRSCDIFSLQTKVQNHLISIQSKFQADLLDKVGTFQADTQDFYSDYGTVSTIAIFLK